VTGFVKSEDILPATAELVRIEKGFSRMNDEDQSLRSEGVAAVFFTTLSSVTAIAIALLPFVTGH
jgi:hypothetical protein